MTEEQRNVATVTDVYQAFSRGDIPHILATLTDDVRWTTHLDPVVPWSGNYQGKREVARFFGAIADAVDTDTFGWDDFVAQGDTVVSFGSYGGTVKATGRHTITRWVFIWKLRDGLIWSYEQFHDHALADAFR